MTTIEDVKKHLRVHEVDDVLYPAFLTYEDVCRICLVFEELKKRIEKENRSEQKCQE